MAKKTTPDTTVAHLRTQYNSLKDRMNDYEAQFEERIRDHPVASVSTAFGTGIALGVLVGWLITRK